MTERFLVLGSNSFSGSHFVERLLREPNTEVVGISRSKEIHPVFAPYRWCGDPERRFRFHALDVNQDLEEILRICRDFRPDYFVNFAAQSMVGQSWQNPEHWMQTNVVSTIRLHDGLRSLKDLKKYVHFSTPEVYGDCRGLVSESTLYSPSTPYAVSRAAADMSLLTFHKAYAFPVVFTRAANVYGPGQQLYRILPRSILYFLTGRTLQLHGGGVAVRSFIHIKDVVEGTLQVARRAKPPAIYHFSTPRQVSIRELVELVAVRMGIDFARHVDVAPARLGSDAAYLLDSSLAREDFGWQPQVTLEAGIQETIDWLSDNLETLRQQPFEYVHKA